VFFLLSDCKLNRSEFLGNIVILNLKYMELNVYRRLPKVQMATNDEYLAIG